MVTGAVLTVPTFCRLRETILFGENYGNHIRDMGDVPDVSKMNSCQKGLLLLVNVHTIQTLTHV